MVDKVILDRFANVIQKGETTLASKVQSRDRYDWIEPEPLAEWQSQSLTLLRVVYGESHSFSTNFVTDTDKKNHPFTGSDAVRAGQGILKAAREDFANGYTWTLKERVHADLFDDYLEMAESLVKDGYKDASAVIAGSTLEEHLRSLSRKNQIATDDSGKPKRAATLNIVLYEQSVYNNVERGQVEAWLAIRNDAAHGKYANYTKEQVEQLINGIRGFFVRHPA